MLGLGTRPPLVECRLRAGIPPCRFRRAGRLQTAFETSDKPFFSYPPHPVNSNVLHPLKSRWRLPASRSLRGPLLGVWFVAIEFGAGFFSGFRRKNRLGRWFIGSFATKDPGRVGIRFLTREEIPDKSKACPPESRGSPSEDLLPFVGASVPRPDSQFAVFHAPTERCALNKPTAFDRGSSVLPSCVSNYGYVG